MTDSPVSLVAVCIGRDRIVGGWGIEGLPLKINISATGSQELAWERQHHQDLLWELDLDPKAGNFGSRMGVVGILDR